MNKVLYLIFVSIKRQGQHFMNIRQDDMIMLQES